jgi:uncharacterized membrane protein
MWRFVSTFAGRAEQTALAYASAVAATTFQRGLLPRTTRDQAIVTGATAALAYGTGVSFQSAIDATSRRIVGNGSVDRENERRAVLAAQATAIVLGAASQVLFRETPHERVPRAVLRTAGRGLGATAFVGAVVTAAEGAVGRRGADGEGLQIPVALPVGAALAGGMYYYVQRRQQRAISAEGRDDAEDATISARRALVMATGLAGALGVVAVAERLAAHGVARGLSWAIGSNEAPTRAIGHAVTLGAMGAGLVAAYHQALAQQERGADAIEAAYAAAPDSEFASGGPRSLVAWEPLSREGRRFVGMGLTRHDIESVMDEPAQGDPLRLYVGLESAADAGSRVDLLLDELVHMKAYERSTICLFAPTGSGYVNYVAVEALEYFTRGDVASICLQYSKRPSFMSLDRVGVGRFQLRDLLRAISTRVRMLPEGQRPRILLFGESLGAHVSQDCFLHQGAQGLHAFDIDAAIWLGTPHASQWRHQVMDDGELPADIADVPSPEALHALGSDRLAELRYLMLTHTEDPIPKFTPKLAVQRPEWLGPAEQRTPGIPRETIWTPVGTFMTVGIDLLNAMNITPGQFRAFAHDYRSDIRPVLQQVFGYEATDEQQQRIDQALRERESTWARERVVADEMARANDAIRRKLEQMGDAVAG